MKFRPCIDLHDGQVKQIVGSTLQDNLPGDLQTNFTTSKPSSWFAELYRSDNLTGGHIIKLGGGNDDAAKLALQTWPGGMQIGGGICLDNAEYWLEAGASHVIVTSYVFRNGQIDEDRLESLVRRVGKERLILDLSCRKKGEEYFVVTDRWQNFTQVVISEKTMDWLSGYCDEFLIHAADVEGKCAGVDVELLQKLSRWSAIPTTYAGGVRNIEDMEYIRNVTEGHLDVTIGSALDIFGGNGLTYEDAVAYHNRYQLS